MALDRNEQLEQSHYRQQALDKGVELDVRFHLEPGTNPETFLKDIGYNIEDCLVATPLENDGFGHLLPNEDKRQFFIG